MATFNNRYKVYLDGVLYRAYSLNDAYDIMEKSFSNKSIQTRVIKDSNDKVIYNNKDIYYF